jgi:hypothetical protein
MGGGARTAWPQPALARLGTCPGWADRSQTHRFRRRLIRSLIRLRSRGPPRPTGTVIPGHGRARPGVNARRTPGKGCWEQTLASSNLASSATPDQAIHKPRSCVRFGLVRLRSLICRLIHSTHIGIKRPKVQVHASECYRGCWRPLSVPALSDQVAAVAVTMGERLGSDDAERSAHPCRMWTARCAIHTDSCAQIVRIWAQSGRG